MLEKVQSEPGQSTTRYSCRNCLLLHNIFLFTCFLSALIYRWNSELAISNDFIIDILESSILLEQKMNTSLIDWCYLCFNLTNSFSEPA
jgi:hypothetical protein